MISIFHLESSVCSLYGIDKSDLQSNSRKKSVAQARWIIWRVLYDVLKWGSPGIGRKYNRDHSTVLYGLKQARMSPLADHYKDFMEIYTKMTDKITE